MDPHLAETLQMLIGLTGATIISVSGMAFWFKKKQLDKGGPGSEEAVETLRGEIDELRADHAEQLAELQERLEFTERLLARGRNQEAGP